MQADIARDVLPVTLKKAAEDRRVKMTPTEEVHNRLWTSFSVTTIGLVPSRISRQTQTLYSLEKAWALMRHMSYSALWTGAVTSAGQEATDKLTERPRL